MIKNGEYYKRWEREYKMRRLSSMPLEESLKAANMLYESGRKFIVCETNLERNPHIMALSKMSKDFRRMRHAGGAD